MIEPYTRAAVEIACFASRASPRPISASTSPGSSSCHARACCERAVDVLARERAARCRRARPVSAIGLSAAATRRRRARSPRRRRRRRRPAAATPALATRWSRSARGDASSSSASSWRATWRARDRAGALSIGDGGGAGGAAGSTVGVVVAGPGSRAPGASVVTSFASLPSTSNCSCEVAVDLALGLLELRLVVAGPRRAPPCSPRSASAACPPRASAATARAVVVAMAPAPRCGASARRPCAPDHEDVGERAAIDAVARVVGVALEHEHRVWLDTTRAAIDFFDDLRLELLGLVAVRAVELGLELVDLGARDRALDERRRPGAHAAIVRRAPPTSTLDRSAARRSPSARTPSRVARRAPSAARADTPRSRPARRSATSTGTGSPSAAATPSGRRIEIEHRAGVRQPRAHERGRRRLVADAAGQHDVDALDVSSFAPRRERGAARRPRSSRRR